MQIKPIDINQRIPLYVLEAVLLAYADDTYSQEYVEQQLRLEFDGENRIKKSVRIVNKIIINTDMAPLLKEKRELLKQALRSEADKNTILISLLNGAFSFSFDTLRSLGKLFSAQKEVSRDALRKTISKKYGGNRAMENAIDSVVPMFFEAGLLTRDKPGLYQFKKPLQLNTTVAADFYKESFQLNTKDTISSNTGLTDPYFIFIS